MVIRTRFAPWLPWSEVIVHKNTTSLGGIARDIYDSLEEKLNVKFSITVQNDLIFGSLGADGKWSGMLGSVQRNETDLSGPYFITRDRSTLVDFTVPVGFSQLSIVSGLVPANRDPFLTFKIFAIQVWILIIVSTLVATGAASFIYAILPFKQKKGKLEVFLRYAWMFYGSLLGKGCGSSKRWFLQPVWGSAGFRILQCAWLIGPALVLLYTYQGAITSTFAADKLKPKIETMEELKDSTNVKPGTLKNSFPSSCFEHLKGTRLSSLYTRVQENLKVPSGGMTPEWLDEVEEGRLAFVAETSYMKSLVGMRCRQTGKCGIRVTPIDFCAAYIAFAFRKNFQPRLQMEFNKRLLWFNEGYLAQRRFLASLASYDTYTQTSTATTQALKLSDVVGAFLVYAIGMCSSIIVLLTERAVSCKKPRNKSIMIEAIQVRKSRKRLLRYNEGYLTRPHLFKSVESYTLCTQKSSSVQSLEINNVVGAFLVYAAGICALVIVFLMETAKKINKKFCY